jgi:hypothetical protein
VQRDAARNRNILVRAAASTCTSNICNKYCNTGFCHRSLDRQKYSTCTSSLISNRHRANKVALIYTRCQGHPSPIIDQCTACEAQRWYHPRKKVISSPCYRRQSAACGHQDGRSNGSQGSYSYLDSGEGAPSPRRHNGAHRRAHDHQLRGRVLQEVSRA